MRAIRNGLYGAGITVENSKGEASAGRKRSTSSMTRRSSPPTSIPS